MTRDHETILEFDYADPESARRVARSVRVEVDDIKDDRANATVDRDGDTVTVSVRAVDLTALRAGVNTWCHLVAVAERCAIAV